MTRMSFWRRIFGAREPEEETIDVEPAPRSKREELKRLKVKARGEADDAPRRRRVTRIRQDVLGLVYEASRASHPQEFGATLRADGDTIVEIVFVPGTLQGDSHAILPLGYLPVDSSLVGTVHSHPGPSAEPSDADLQLFRHFGHTHIILHEPYDDWTWIAYDQEGNVIELEVVDI